MKRCIAVIFFFFFLMPALSQERNAVYLNKEGWNYIEKRDGLQALLHFKSALSQNPEYKEARIGLGYAYLLRNAYSDAFDAFSAVAPLYPRDEQILVGRGHALSGLGQYDQALELYTQASAINSENTEALYGTAQVYYRMDKGLWAERTIANILRLNPYHYDTLLLAAAVKYEANRLDEAEDYIKKAVNVRREYPDAYVSYGRLLLMRYEQTGERGYLADAQVECSRAAAIQPDMLAAKELLGIISLIHDDPLKAQEYFADAQTIDAENVSNLYNLAYTHSLLGNREEAEKNMRSALKPFPDHPLINGALEHFYIRNNYAFGNPGRLERAREHYQLYESNSDRSLSEYALIHLRRSIQLNPMNPAAHRKLAEYYKVAGYDRLYIDKLKDLQRLYPGNENQERLNLAVIQRRDKLYNREGYALTMPPRDVVRVAVAPFARRRMDFYFYDGGEVFADSLSFSLKQFGRMEIAGARELEGIGREYTVPTQAELIKALVDSDIDYILTGNYSYVNGTIEADFSLVNNRTGAVDSNFELQENGKESLTRICYRAAKRIYEALPARGTILKLDRNSTLVNLGLIDGVSVGDLFYARDTLSVNSPRKVLFEVTEADTYMAKAKLLNPLDYDRISKGNRVFRLNRRKARLIK